MISAGVTASDDELLQRANGGEAEAFGELFERHAPAVLSFCFHRTGSVAAAEDLTSVVFLEAWRKRDRVVFFEGRARPWLLGVAVNVVRAHARAERRHREALRRLPVSVLPEAESEAAAGRLDAERRMAAILRAVEKLERRERDVIELCVWEGLSAEEAALALGTTAGAVRSRLSRARRRLPLLEAMEGAAS